jgi:carbonic anhydrase/acetyltransferase-like protein (isoleucine patch superfamily)
MRKKRTRENCKSFREGSPKIHETVFMAPNAVIKGDVTIGELSSVWFHAVIRGEFESVTIGKKTNIQDGVIVHVDWDKPASIGDRVTIGHRAIIHASTVGSDTIVGMGSIILNDVKIGPGSVVAAGAVVIEGFKAPPRSILAGIPAKIIGTVSPKLRERIKTNCEDYLKLAEEYKMNRFPGFGT